MAQRGYLASLMDCGQGDYSEGEEYDEEGGDEVEALPQRTYQVAPTGEQAGREQAGKEQGGRDQAGKDQAGRQQGGRQQATQQGPQSASQTTTED
jgi:hypothetical protein